MTYREAREKAARELRSVGIGEADTESRLLLMHVGQMDFGGCLLHEADPMPTEQEARYADLIRRRKTRIPLQYLTGEQEFMGLPFFVTGDVLIPRQDTELLAETAIRFLREREIAPLRSEETGTGKSSGNASKPTEPTGRVRILDLCTGSGCLAISLAHFFPEAEVVGSDSSGAALSLAVKNAVRNGADVAWVKSDLFDAVDGAFDLIVCNPPYIPTAVIDTLMPEVRDFEPRAALDGGEDGLSFYRRILATCGGHLKAGGCLLFEIGAEEGCAVTNLMKESDFIDIQVIRDPAGLDRVVTGRKIDV